MISIRGQCHGIRSGRIIPVGSTVSGHRDRMGKLNSTDNGSFSFSDPQWTNYQLPEEMANADQVLPDHFFSAFRFAEIRAFAAGLIRFLVTGF